MHAKGHQIFKGDAAMKALVFERPHELLVKEIDVPRAAADEVLIRVHACGICGTDIHILEGGFPGAYPLVPGHEFSGEVVAVGGDCRRIRVSDRVAVEPNVPCNNCPECLRGEHHYCRNMIVPGVTRGGGFAEYVAVKEWGVFSIGGLDYGRGALVEPLSCAIHAVERLAPRLGDRVLVMGAGPIGLLLGRLLKLYGVLHVDFLERLDERRATAAREGCGSVYAATDAVPEKYYECVVDATGVSALVGEAANRFVRVRGKVLAFGVPKPDGEVRFDHFRVFRDEVQIIGSFTSLKNTIQAIDVMSGAGFEVDDIISDRISLTQAPLYIARLARGDGALRKVMVTDFLA